MLLMGDASNLSTVRAEITRLRSHLGGGILQSRPYRLNLDLTPDFFRVRSALRDGRPGAALKEYAGPLLPSSEAEGVEEARGYPAVQLRAAGLCPRQPRLLPTRGETS